MHSFYLILFNWNPCFSDRVLPFSQVVFGYKTELPTVARILGNRTNIPAKKIRERPNNAPWWTKTTWHLVLCPSAKAASCRCSFDLSGFNLVVSSLRTFYFQSIVSLSHECSVFANTKTIVANFYSESHRDIQAVPNYPLNIRNSLTSLPINRLGKTHFYFTIFDAFLKKASLLAGLLRSKKDSQFRFLPWNRRRKPESPENSLLRSQPNGVSPRSVKKSMYLCRCYAENVLFSTA